MSKDVTIVRDGVICTGAAKSMYDEAGDEVLMVKVLKSRKAPTNKTAAKAVNNETRIIKRGITMELPAKRRAGRAPIPVICENTGVEFESLSAAARHFFPNRSCTSMISRISKCCNNERSSINGIKFRYLQ